MRIEGQRIAKGIALGVVFWALVVLIGSILAG